MSSYYLSDCEAIHMLADFPLAAALASLTAPTMLETFAFIAFGAYTATCGYVTAMVLHSDNDFYDFLPWTFKVKAVVKVMYIIPKTLVVSALAAAYMIGTYLVRKIAWPY